MAVVPSNQGSWFNSNSSRIILDFSWLFGGTLVHSKKGVETINPLLAAGPVDPGCTDVDQESNSEAAQTVENRCDQEGNAVLSSDVLGSSGTTSVVQEVSDVETSELEKIFQKFDENQDGLICAVDLRRFMGRLGFEVTEDEAVSMLATVDHNGDGHVGFEEFCTLYTSLDERSDSRRNGEKEEDDDEEEDDTLLEAFRVFDKNNDGSISCKELQSVLLALGLAEGKSLKSCELMIQGVDSDGNGEVDIKEFKEMMSSNSFLR